MKVNAVKLVRKIIQLVCGKGGGNIGEKNPAVMLRKSPGIEGPKYYSSLKQRNTKAPSINMPYIVSSCLWLVMFIFFYNKDKSQVYINSRTSSLLY